MNYIATHNSITRGTAFPLVMEITELGDLTEWDVTFTMRTNITSTGDPLLQCDNEDLLYMRVTANKVTVNLSQLDTLDIPENAKLVFIQLNFTKLAKTVATEIYSLAVLPNIKKQDPVK